MFNGKMMHLKAADGFEFAAYDVHPSGPHKGGLVMVQEIFGVNDDMKRAADRFARHGYHVIAPSMYDRLEPGFSLDDHSPESIQKAGGLARQNGLENAMMDIKACFEALEPEGSVYVTGFCYGGSMSWLAACNIPGFKAASAYYGSLLAGTKDQTPHCPVIAHFGKLDPHIPLADGEAFAAANPDVPTYFYEAGHGFAREGSDDYDAESDRLALERTLALFEANP